MTSQSRIKNLMRNAKVMVNTKESNHSTIHHPSDFAVTHQNNNKNTQVVQWLKKVTTKESNHSTIHHPSDFVVTHQNNVSNNNKNIQVVQWLKEVAPTPILEPFDFEQMDVEISPYLEPTKLFEEVRQDNGLVIEVPSVPNEFCLESACVQSVQPELIDNTTIEFLPMMKPISESSIDNDPEYIDGIVESNGGRKRNIVNKKKQIKLIKNKLPNEWMVNCIHKDQIKDKVCNIALLSADEISTFKNNLCSCTSKIDQDKFILTFVNISAPKRIDRKKTDRIDRTVTNYFIPAANGNMVKVCVVAFSSVTSLTRRRLNLVTKTFNITHSSPVEKRGGYRLNYTATEITQSIEDHIKNFKCRKSHHTRRDTGRCYLQPGLSIKYMWTHWTKKRISEKKATCSLSKYQNIFTNKFNLSFGHPRQDVCSLCTEQKIKINVEQDNDIKNELLLELNVHKQRAKKFFELLKEKMPDTITCSFDMMQTQPLPKLSVTEVFYSRQVWLYNLTFVISESNFGPAENFLYTWTETESGRGPNEVCSALIDFLDLLENKVKTYESPPTTLNLFSDSCSGQNKNQFTMVTLLHYINCRATIFKKINHFFPTRGHSYMPPDRVFGQIEQVLRKKETIVSPQQYHQVFEKFCSVKVYHKDFLVYNYKDAVKKFVKSKTEFKSTQQKRFSYIKGDKTVGISTTYNGLPIKIEVIKRNSDLSTLTEHLIELPKTNHVKALKQKDVKNLLKFFTIPDDAKTFYSDIFQESSELNVDDIVDEYNEDQD